MFDLKKFGANISKLRKAKDFTQSELAEKLDSSIDNVSRYENGESYPSEEMINKMSAALSIPVLDLINAGEPTKAEAALLYSNYNKDDVPHDVLKENILDEIKNIAPLLRPSLLEKVAAEFAKQGIDISKLVDLAEYINDNAFLELIENSDIDAFDRTLLEKFLPFLNDQSKYSIFEKIIEGILDYHYLEILLPYADYLIEHVEAAVLFGALSEDSLRILNEYQKV